MLRPDPSLTSSLSPPPPSLSLSFLSFFLGSRTQDRTGRISARWTTPLSDSQSGLLIVSTIDDRSHRKCAADAHGILFLMFKHTSAHRARIPFLTRCRLALAWFAIKFADYIGARHVHIVRPSRVASACYYQAAREESIRSLKAAIISRYEVSLVC